MSFLSLEDNANIKLYDSYVEADEVNTIMLIKNYTDVLVELFGKSYFKVNENMVLK